jgi:transcriptional regulator with XRE-family HTH domain
VSRWESGAFPPLAKYRKQLAALYGVPEEELMKGGKEYASGEAGAR